MCKALALSDRPHVIGKDVLTRAWRSLLLSCFILDCTVGKPLAREAPLNHFTKMCVHYSYLYRIISVRFCKRLGDSKEKRKKKKRKQQNIRRTFVHLCLWLNQRVSVAVRTCVWAHCSRHFYSITPNITWQFWIRLLASQGCTLSPYKACEHRRQPSCSHTKW